MRPPRDYRGLTALVLALGVMANLMTLIVTESDRRAAGSGHRSQRHGGADPPVDHAAAHPDGRDARRPAHDDEGPGDHLGAADSPRPVELARHPAEQAR